MTQSESLATIIEAASDPAVRDRMLAAVTQRPTVEMGTVKEAAAILGVCARSCERYARQGRIRRVHLSPRKVRYDLESCRVFLSRGAQGVEALEG